MRPFSPKTLLAIALGIASVSGPTIACNGPFGQAGDTPPCGDQRLNRLTDRLDLDPEQETKVKAILAEEDAATERLRLETRQRITGLLTESQRAELDQQMQRRLDRRAERLAKRLNLSPEQEKQVRAIIDERRTNPDLTRAQIKERIAAVLTPEQQQRFDTLEPRGDHWGRHGCRPVGPGPDGDPDDNR